MVGLKGRHGPHPLVGGRNTGKVALTEYRDRVRIRVSNVSAGLNHRAKTGGVRGDNDWD